MRKLVVLLFLIAVATAGCTEPKEEPSDISQSQDKTETTIAVEMSIGETPVGKTLVEYFVSVPYSSEMDRWMKEYAQEHRISDEEELHLFTFSEGKQFEYWMSSTAAKDSGSLFPSSWTEEPDESLSPNKISKEQFEENISSLISGQDEAYFEWQTDDNYGERLYVYTGQPLSGLSPSDAASFLKNYIDFKPDRDVYGLVIQAPAADGQNTIIKSFVYHPKDHKLDEVKMTSLGSASDNTVWTDATYTSIVNAVETNTFTNHPGKKGSLLNIAFC